MSTLDRETLRKIRRIRLHTRLILESGIVGSYHAAFKGRGMEFAEVREYQPGDDVRTIDWNVTARSGIPHVKKYIEERDLTLLLLIDISGSSSFGSRYLAKRDLAAEISGVLAFSAVANKDRVGAVLFSDEVEMLIPPSRGEMHALRIVRETDSGVVLRGKVGMHTSPAYAEDVYLGSLCGVEYGGNHASFILPVNAPGVRIVCRPISTRDENPFVAPLSHRFDELDGQMWLDDVHVPYERMFLVEPSPEPIARWLFWHQLYSWLAKAEFTLGLGLACTHAMSLAADEATVGYLLDLITDVQTVRSCLVAAERDPQFTPAGYCHPNHNHIAAGSIAMLKARPRMSETLRILPGSSLILAPTDKDLAAPEVAAGLEAAFGGGGYDARQRAAVLRMAWDHVSSALDSRESVYELHANGGVPTWRQRLRRSFEDYNSLANGVVQQLGMPMPDIDLSGIREAPLARRRQVVVEAPKPEPK